MQIFPLIDPNGFFSVLPNPPKVARVAASDRKYFDDLGYMKVPNAGRIANLVWTRKGATGSDPYDFDLSIMVHYFSDSTAAKGEMAGSLSRDKKLSSKCEKLSTNLKATESFVLRINDAKMPGMYVASARYVNYVFRFAALTAVNGYFESESHFLDRLKALDTHIDAVLRGGK